MFVILREAEDLLLALASALLALSLSKGPAQPSAAPPAFNSTPSTPHTLSCISVRAASPLDPRRRPRLARTGRRPLRRTPAARLHQPTLTTTSPTTTQQHLRTSPWWPTKPLSPKEQQAQYAGTQTCATCHAGIAQSQETSQMAHTLSRPATSSVLNLRPLPDFQPGPFRSTLAHHGKDAQISVTGDGQPAPPSSIGPSAPATSAKATFGSRTAPSAKAASTSSPPSPPSAPPPAASTESQPLSTWPSAAPSSTSKPAPASPATPPPWPPPSPLDLKSIVPGVSCESCHGPGAAHVAAARARQANPSISWPGQNKLIVNSARMSPAESVDLCGACHSTPWDVRVMGAVGLQTIRFPAYRLEKSKVLGRLRRPPRHLHRLPRPTRTHPTRARRLRQRLPRLPRQDSPGLRRPQSPRHPNHSVDPGPKAKACPVATSKYVTCHMPKVDLPEMHYKCTDHNIRIVRNGDPFPD